MTDKEQTKFSSSTGTNDPKQQFRAFRQASIELSRELAENKNVELSKPHNDQLPEAKSVIVDTSLETETTFQNMILSLLGIQVLIIILFASCTKESFVDNFTDVYQMFTGIEIMMFFGFGYLMTFLKRYGMGAVGFTMLITVVGLQWGILTEGFFTHWYANDWGYLEVNILSFINGLFLVAAILISFGAIIGKVSPLQLVIMTFLEAIFYSINKSVLCLGVVTFFDAGGTINIHMFGAYFGLAVSYIIGKPKASTSSEGGHIADLFSLIGTIFLWIYWPSFNGGTLDVNSHSQQRAILNTVLALSSATTGAFITSSFLSSNWKIRPVDIQNATLAGGVAIGAVCGMTLRFSDPLIIGFVAGIVSSIGFSRIQAILDDYGLHDTCGIHNLHAIPSLIGAFASVILAAYKGPQGHDYPDVMPHEDQWKVQLAAIGMTLCLAIVSGIFTGFILRLFAPSADTESYTDAPYWEVMDDFGRSFEKEYGDLEEGIKASRKLSSIVAKFAALGLDLSNSNHGKSSSWVDFSSISKHSLNSSKHDLNASKHSFNNSKHDFNESKHNLGDTTTLSTKGGLEF